MYIYSGFVWACMCVRVCVCACVCVCGCVTACVSARLIMCAHLSACRVELYNDHKRLQMHVSNFVKQESREESRQQFTQPDLTDGASSCDRAASTPSANRPAKRSRPPWPPDKSPPS